MKVVSIMSKLKPKINSLWHAGVLYLASLTCDSNVPRLVYCTP